MNRTPGRKSGWTKKNICAMLLEAECQSVNHYYTWRHTDGSLVEDRPLAAVRRAYLVNLRKKCQTTIAGLSDEKAHQQVDFPWVGEKPMSFLELLLYTMRHVQEHAAQLNLFLGQNASDVASDWVSRAKADEVGE